MFHTKESHMFVILSNKTSMTVVDTSHSFDDLMRAWSTCGFLSEDFELLSSTARHGDWWVPKFLKHNVNHCLRCDHFFFAHTWRYWFHMICIKHMHTEFVFKILMDKYRSYVTYWRFKLQNNGSIYFAIPTQMHSLFRISQLPHAKLLHLWFMHCNALFSKCL